ncbi:MAG: hypothetical protein J5742_00700 [Alphaproteobacteria bacterium]|nr:hypothetical protein [Alphaproteobacteria bacterium]
MKKPIIFSLFREQSVFMTAVMGIMTFLAVMALGISIAIGTGVTRWNKQWNLYATVQTTDSENASAIKKVLDTNQSKFAQVREVSTDEMAKLMRPWISGGKSVLEKYLPKMYEIKFKNESDIAAVRESVGTRGRFITHQDALRPSISAGWKMVAILSVVLGIIILTIGICISFIAKNTAILHKRELEILNQVGASDSFVARQMQIIVAKICMTACSLGFVAAVPIIIAIIAVAHSARVGIMATIGISGGGWFALICVPIAIFLFAIVITKRTTLKILNQD